MNCYEAIDLMGDALDGALPTEARAGFDDHIEECPSCRTYLDQLRVTLKALERLPRSTASSRRRAELIAAFRREFPARR